LAILAAGPFANLLVGVLLYAIIFTQIGRPITNQVQVIEVAQNSPAEQAGLLQGDLILQINNTEIDSTTALQEAIFASLEQSTAVTIERQGETLQFTLVPRENPPPGEGAIGIVMGNPTTPINLLSALPMGSMAVYEHIGQLLQFPIRIIQGQISPEQGRLAGYKGMFDIYQQVQRRETLPGVPGSVNVLGFFATITISFAVLNLLPIPALDGGRITFLIPEIVLRKRIPPQYENVINLVSFGLLLMILLYINIQDFVNPIQLPK
jgi:regulator of sigma E protease